ncbi:MAG: nucleoside-diphosphate sugar epimerase [Bacteroidetes bacterium]|nr:MAG: nucleoside-diphosphate sugar epimerase [Bacteroidota bacterium]
MKKTAIILGATGLTGSHLLDFLLNSDDYEKVKVFTRRATGKTHPKLEEITCDVLKLKEQTDKFIADEVFVCIGTTRAKTPDKNLYHAIDYGIPVTSAKLAERNNIQTFSVVSAVGADVNSSIFYSRTKGEMERDILKCDIPNILIYRPSIIYGNRKDNRLGEKIGTVLIKGLQFLLFGKLKKYRAISGKDKMKSIEEIKASCKEIDKVLFEAEKEFKEIEEINQRLKEFSEKMAIIENFYFNGDWQKDREELEKENEDNFYCMSEDGIWNLSVAYQQERLKIVKQLVAEL